MFYLNNQLVNKTINLIFQELYLSFFWTNFKFISLIKSNQLIKLNKKLRNIYSLKLKTQIWRWYQTLTLNFKSEVENKSIIINELQGKNGILSENIA